MEKNSELEKQRALKEKYCTETHILSLAGAFLFCLCDDYPCDIPVGTELYPSVRHAVLSYKTDDLQIKARIKNARTPADLRAIEQTIPPGSRWNAFLAEKLLEHFSLIKFNRYPECAAVLKGTHPKKILNGTLEGVTIDNGIEELKDTARWSPHGKVLMDIRKMLLAKQ